MKKITLLIILLISSIGNINAQSLNFDGSDDYVSGGNILTPSYTKEAWVYLTANTGSNNIISGGNNTGQHAFWAPGQTLSAGHNGNWSTVQDNTTLNLNQWYHVAVSYDAVSQTMTLYKNGTQVSQASSVGYTNGNGFNIGAYEAASNLFEGNIDEVHIWSTVRTAAQIQSDMSCSFATAQPGLIASYNFNQGTPNGTNTGITTLTDGSGNNNNGTLNNFALTGTTSNWVDDVNMTAVYPDVTFSGINAICAGGNTVLTASSTLATSYAWSANAGSATTASVALSPSATDVYTVNATNGVCVAADTISVFVTATPTISFSGNTTICAGTTTTLTASGATTYTWSANAGSATTATVALSPGATDTYTLTAANGGCTTTSLISVSVTATPTINISGNTSICSGTTTTLTASGATSYTWSANAGSVTTASVSATLNSPETFSVTGTSSGCTTTATVNISVAPTPSVFINSPTSICQGDNHTLTATGTASTFLWSANAGSATTNTATPVTNSTDTYTVVGFSGACSDTATITVTVNSLPTVTVSGSTICAQQTATLTASSPTAVSYLWNTGETSATIYSGSLSSTDFTVTAIDAHNCMSSTTTSLTVNSLPIVSATSPVICTGSTGTITASGTATTFTWSTGENGASITPSPTVTTDYTVTGADANGCTNIATTTITVNSLPVVSVSSATACAGSPATLTASGTSTYTWSTTELGASIAPSATTTTDYTVSGSDLNGCTNSAIATLTVIALPTINISGNSTAVCAGTTTSLTASGANTYTWSTNATTASVAVTPTTTTDYTVTGTDNTTLCTNTMVATLTVIPLPDNTVVSNAGLLTAINAVATYQWINCNTHSAIATETNQTYMPTVTGSYQVKLTENGCVDTSACYLVTVTGIQDLSNADLIRMYPNPATDALYIQTNMVFENASIEVYDMIGQKVLTESVQSNMTRLNIADLNNAVYYVRVVNNNTLIYQNKIVKQQ